MQLIANKIVARRGPRLLGLVVAAVTLASVPAEAQRTTRVEIDNDAFNFWQPAPSRFDREYTQGTRLTMVWPTAGALARRLLGGAARCDLADATKDCRLLAASVLQEIYTPTLNTGRRTANERPFAGLLGVDVGLRREWQRGFRAFGLTAGMTGGASLAAPAQRTIHSLFGFTAPIGWEAQLPGELALLASWQEARALVQLRSPQSGLSLHIAPQWRLRLGTLATDASGGVHITAGLRAPAPWQVALAPGREPWGLYVRVGASQSAVARNLFLDGATFRQSARVPRNRFVGETVLGIGVRAPRGLLEWTVHRRGREYALQPTAHAYSTFSFTLH